jgi:cobalt-zinc-cadmium efflux system membrane fusion protein
VAMKSICAFAVAAVVVSGACGRQAAAPATEDGREPVSVTRWTERTELFFEYPPLVEGEISRFAIHLTRLDSFQALTEGHVEVLLSGGSAPREVFRVDAPSRPGIFLIDVKAAHAGARELDIVLRAPDLEDEHRVGSVTVHKTDVEARAAADTRGESALRLGSGLPAEEISFLKEQQWALDFGTALVGEQSLRDTLRVSAQIVARPGGAADVVAPIDGRLIRVLDAPVGTAVFRGQEIARLLPPPSAAAELPQLQQAHTEARSALDLATRDRERAERLVAAGAAPQKRLDEARATEAQVHARLEASEARLAQYDAARTAGDATNMDGLFLIRAPVRGVIALREAAAGANVSGGTLLFRIVDAERVHVVGNVPEADVARARNAKAAELEVPGSSSRVPLGRIAGLGRVLDPRTRTVPIIFTVDNSTLGLPVGQAVFLHLLMEPAPPHPVVPVSAVVDDAARPVVFVQREGETFERRAVRLGARTGDLVQVLDGVERGERVVAKGAYLLRLASLTPQSPAHGHVH